MLSRVEVAVATAVFVTISVCMCVYFHQALFVSPWRDSFSPGYTVGVVRVFRAADTVHRWIVSDVFGTALFVVGKFGSVTCLGVVNSMFTDGVSLPWRSLNNDAKMLWFWIMGTAFPILMALFHACVKGKDPFHYLGIGYLVSAPSMFLYFDLMLIISALVIVLFTFLVWIFGTLPLLIVGVALYSVVTVVALVGVLLGLLIFIGLVLHVACLFTSFALVALLFTVGLFVLLERSAHAVAQKQGNMPRLQAWSDEHRNKRLAAWAQLCRWCMLARYACRRVVARLRACCCCRRGRDVEGCGGEGEGGARDGGEEGDRGEEGEGAEYEYDLAALDLGAARAVGAAAGAAAPGADGGAAVIGVVAAAGPIAPPAFPVRGSVGDVQYLEEDGRNLEVDVDADVAVQETSLGEMGLGRQHEQHGPHHASGAVAQQLVGGGGAEVAEVVELKPRPRARKGHRRGRGGGGQCLICQEVIHAPKGGGAAGGRAQPQGSDRNDTGVGEFFSVEPCGHGYCTPCFVRYTHTCLEDSADKFPLKCPNRHADGCQSLIHSGDLEVLVGWRDQAEYLAPEGGAALRVGAILGIGAGAGEGEVPLAFTRENFHRIEQYEEEAAIPANVRVFCINPACARVGRLPPGSSLGKRTWTCHHCQSIMCCSCRQRQHGSLSCEAARAANVPMDRATAAAIQDSSRPCPKCRAPISRFRDHACHHVICTAGGCGASFCYACGTKYKGGFKSCSCNAYCDDRCSCPVCPDCSSGRPCPVMR